MRQTYCILVRAFFGNQHLYLQNKFKSHEPTLVLVSENQVIYIHWGL